MLPLLSKLLTSTGLIFLPSIPWFVAKTYESRAELKRVFKLVEFLDLETAGQLVSVVRGHNSISVFELEKMGKPKYQLKKISASMASVKSQLSSTGALSESKGLHGFVNKILQGRPLESMKMIQLGLDHV
jgi:hypothetical protein